MTHQEEDSSQRGGQSSLKSQNKEVLRNPAILSEAISSNVASAQLGSIKCELNVIGSTHPR